MIDRQIHRKPESSRIPLISPLLHVLAMPLLVVMRRNFGYRFLSPKSIFLSLCWTMLLFGIYSYYRPENWIQHRFLSCFLAASAALYLVHLLRAVVTQWGDAPHDQFGGESWFSFLSLDGEKVAQWIEPGLVLIAAIGVRAFFGDSHFITFLLAGAVLLMLKEGINQWGRVRKVRTQLDATDDAESTMGKVSEKRDGKASRNSKSKPVATSRKQRVQRKRVRAAEENREAEVEKHAAVLRLLPPYSVEQANENYQKLVRQFHPDDTEFSVNQNEALAQLNEAVEYFRSDYSH